MPARSRTATEATDPEQTDPHTVDSRVHVNTSLIVGTLRAEPTERTLADGRVAVSLDVQVRCEGAKATSVPMVWYDPPKRLSRLKVGQPVVVSGSIVRRFYRGRAGLVSKTEVNIVDAAPAGTAWAERIVRAVRDRIIAAVT